jgi:hypothetical protein
VNPAAAAKALTARGVDVAGTPIEAWSWTDRSGHNLFLTTKQPVLGEIYDGVMRNGILTAYDARGVGSAHMKVTVPLEMNNNEGPGRPLCDVDGGLDFVNYSTVVSDSNHDGVAEVALGWWRMCRGDVGPATANLLVSTGGRAYRISGTGTPIELTKAERDAHIFPPAGRFPLTATPSPRPGAWPRGVYADADALYHATFRS